MSNRKLIYYDDARHYHFYIPDPPITHEQVTAPIDAAAGTGVDTFVWGFGVGPTVFHDSKVADIFASHLEVIGDVASWRAYENSMSLIRDGEDALTVMIDRAHEVGMDFIGSLRLTHSSNPNDKDNAHNWRFKIEHPEWVLKGTDDPERKNSFNWVHPEVRAERFAIAEETIVRYDVDGIELDLSFSPFYFEADEVTNNLHVVTEFIRDLRAVAQRSNRKGKGPAAIGARILPTLSANLEAGFDVETWISEGLLDFVVPNVYGHIPIDPDFPFEWVTDLASGTNCEVYPAMGSIAGGNREGYASVEHYRAAAAAYWDRGADAIYLPWFRWPIGPEERQLFSEMGDPDVLSELPKRYFMAPQHTSNLKFGHTSMLPVNLEVGQAKTVSMHLAEDVDRARATLCLRLDQSTSLDDMTILINGTELDQEHRKYTPFGYTYSTLEFILPEGTLVHGRNEVSVRVDSRPMNLDRTVVLSALEIDIDYPKTETPTAMV